MNFEDSRTISLVEAEAARGGPAPATALILLISGCVDAGAPIAEVKKLIPTFVQAIIIATGEKDKTFQTLCGALKAFGGDLADIAKEDLE